MRFEGTLSANHGQGDCVFRIHSKRRFGLCEHRTPDMEEVLETALRGNSKVILLINMQLHEEVKDLDLGFPAPNFYFDKRLADVSASDMFMKMLSKTQKHLVGSCLSL